MDDYYPSLKRPKKKLLFPATKPCHDQWAQDIHTLEDVDKMFDALESNDADFPSPSPEIHIASKSKHVKRDETPLRAPEEQLKCQMVANGDSKHPHHSPDCPELDIISETPFKAHKPISTSSPIEGNVIQQELTGHNSASPILFDCEDEKQDLETAETPTEKTKDKNNKRDESSSEFETLPKKSVLDDVSAQNRKMVPKKLKPSSPPASPLRRKVLKATPSEKLPGKDPEKLPGKDPEKLPGKDPEKLPGEDPEKLPEKVQVSTKIKHDVTSFLQKLKDAGQPKPAVARISQAKVLAPLPEPEAEDEFIILEEDVPLFVSIPNKLSKKTKERQTKASCSDTEAKGTSGEEHSADKLRDIEQDHRQQESQAKKTQTNDCRSGSNEDCLSLAMTESENMDNLLQQNKKKKVKKVLSKNEKNTETDIGTETDVEFPGKKIVKGDKTVKKASKSLKNDKEYAKKKTLRNEKRKGAKKAEAVSDEVDIQSQEVHSENPLDDNAPGSEEKNVESAPSEDRVDGNIEQNKPSLREEISDEDIVVGKRKRRPPGNWWIHSNHSSEQKAIDKQRTVKKTNLPNKKLISATSSGTAATVGEKNYRKQSSSSSDSQKQNAEKKNVRKGKLKRARPVTTAVSAEPEEDLGQAIQGRALHQDSDSSPLLFPHRERSLSSDQRAFDKVYQNWSSEKKSSSLDRATHTGLEGLQGSQEPPKRKRKAPGNWWEVNPTAEDQEMASSQPQQQKPKELKTEEKRKKKQDKKAIKRSPSKPLEGAPKQKKRSLTSTRDLVSIVEVSPPLKKLVTLKKQSNVTTSPAEVIEADHNVLSIQMDQLPGVQDQSPDRDRVQDTMQESISKVIISGPSSMIGLENYDDIELPSTTVQPALCASDLCSAPLRPLTLLPKDKVNLQVWLNYLWSTADKNPKITTEDFEWYCHRNRAMGIMTDLQTGCICNGKMLLGSFMKKPLWVDHSATTMFNLLTSSIRVVMDCNKSQYSAGQSFMVPPGHAYSIHNLMPEPAVLYFTRFFTEEPDE